jgi:hypothetical protein
LPSGRTPTPSTPVANDPSDPAADRKPLATTLVAPLRIRSTRLVKPKQMRLSPLPWH